MKKMFFLILIISVTANLSFAKECPSNLPANLNQLGEREFYYGIEFRLWAYYMDEHNYEKGKRESDIDFPYSVVPMIQVFPTDNLTLQAAGLMAYRKDLQGDYDDEGFILRLREAWAELYVGSAIIRTGRQLYTFGNQLVLDNRFDMAEVAFDTDKVGISFFGGALAYETSREAISCMRWREYYNSVCWKGFCLDTEYSDHLLYGGIVEPKLSARHNQQLLILYQDAPNEDNYDAIIASLYLNGKLGKRFRYSIETAYQKRENTEQFGVMAFLHRFIRFDGAMPNIRLKLGYLYGSQNDDEKFAPLYESAWLGERQKYSTHQGNTRFWERKIHPKFSENVKFDLNYYLHSLHGKSEFYSDELDFGMQYQFSPKYRFWLMYSLLNNIGDLERVHQLKLETRLIF